MRSIDCKSAVRGYAKNPSASSSLSGRCYYLRPQGRYDLIWSALSRSTALFDKTRGLIDELQRQIAPPEPGGLDVVLDRIRPLAAPLVLSSRRLDLPIQPGRTVPPGVTWEVLIARHNEQELVDRNRGLVDHLGFRQVAHALVRSFTHQETNKMLRPAVAKVVSGPFPATGSKIGAKTFRLIAGTAAPATFTLKATDEISDLVAQINLAGGSTIVAFEEFVTGPLGGSRLVFATPPSPLNLFLVDVDGSERDLLNYTLDLSDATFETGVNVIAPTVADNRLPKLPALPKALEDHLNLAALDPDDALSIDLPLRSERFTQGLMALQWRGLPYYYAHRLLIVAQAAAVASPIAVVNQVDFSYASPVYNDPQADDPALRAVMEGVDFPGPVGRRRRIVFSLAPPLGLPHARRPAILDGRRPRRRGQGRSQEPPPSAVVDARQRRDLSGPDRAPQRQRRGAGRVSIPGERDILLQIPVGDWPVSRRRRARSCRRCRGVASAAA